MVINVSCGKSSLAAGSIRGRPHHFFRGAHPVAEAVWSTGPRARTWTLGSCRMQYGRPPPQLRRTSSCLVCFLCNLMGNLRGCTSTPSPFSPPSCMEGVGWEHGELAWSLHASYPCSIPHPTPLPHLRHRPLCVSVMLSPYFSTFFERRKKGRSHMKLSFMAILIHCEQLLSYTYCFLHP